jgi:hypothetical protein
MPCVQSQKIEDFKTTFCVSVSVFTRTRTHTGLMLRLFCEALARPKISSSAKPHFIMQLIAEPLFSPIIFAECLNFFG